MKLFSQRMGFKPVKSIMQTESMDEDLQNGLWSALYDYYWTKEDYEEVFKASGFEVIEFVKPLATGNEPFELYSEKDHSPFFVFALKKS